ncbi:hypothetical protein IE53DRAFT_230668 [Violaceomyces palustris]|uniref:Uncharacterized protein n=1 Tax=Violaceomyces palustris TaxID=1673888 RepID=A0ACD0P4E0_9BASI|nr:hypothetical protein IE53DRAFT_230668 [Violaceomyces palustris]
MSTLSSISHAEPVIKSRSIVTPEQLSEKHSALQIMTETLNASPLSSPSESSASSSPDDSFKVSPILSRRPSAGILCNAHESPARLKAANKSATSLSQAFKNHFKQSTPGRQAKTDGKPLGKTFHRKEPLPGGCRFEGAEVLPYDPRGEKATAGDGVLPPGAILVPNGAGLASHAGGGGGSGSEIASSVGDDSEALQSSDLSQSFRSDSSAAWSTPDRDDFDSHRGRTLSPSDIDHRRVRQASVTSTTSTTSSSNPCAIRFAPLPTSGRLKRANSITIGVAARSHLLYSQGTAAPPRQMPMHPGYQYGGWCQAPPPTYVHPRADEVIDVGEEIKKGAIKAWKMVRGSNKKNGQAKDATAASAAAPTSANDKADGSGSPAKKGGPGSAGGDTAISALANDTKASDAAKDSDIPDHPLLVSCDTSRPAPGSSTPGSQSSARLDVSKLRIAEDEEEVRGGKGEGDDDTGVERIASPTRAAMVLTTENDAGHRTEPRGLVSSAQDFGEGPQHGSFHHSDSRHLENAVGMEGDEEEEGVRTPRLGMQRRVSTGTFLKGLSIRHMQEDRRKELGIDEEAIYCGARDSADFEPTLVGEPEAIENEKGGILEAGMGDK